MAEKTTTFISVLTLGRKKLFCFLVSPILWHHRIYEVIFKFNNSFFSLPTTSIKIFLTLSESVVMRVLSSCDLLCESGFCLNLHQFKASDCDYSHSTAMTSGVLIHVVSHLSSVSFRKKPAWLWSWKLWLSSGDHRYHKALKTLLGYVKILDSPFKGELGFLKTGGLYSRVEFACVHGQVLMHSFPKRLFIHFIFFRFLYLHLTHCNLYVTALYLLVWWILF